MLFYNSKTFKIHQYKLMATKKIQVIADITLVIKTNAKLSHIAYMVIELPTCSYIYIYIDKT